MPNTRLWRARLPLFVALLYTLLIVYGSLANPQSLPRVSHGLSDKWIHFLGYFFLFWIWFAYLFLRRSRFQWINNLLAITLIGLLFGIIVEVLQATQTEQRQGEFLDVAANFGGLASAALLAWFFKSKLTLLKKWFLF